MTACSPVRGRDPGLRNRVTYFPLKVAIWQSQSTFAFVPVTLYEPVEETI
jgi:hypothetical protein